MVQASQLKKSLSEASVYICHLPSFESLTIRTCCTKAENGSTKDLYAKVGSSMHLIGFQFQIGVFQS